MILRPNLSQHKHQWVFNKSGFSLLEIVITIGLLLILTIAIAGMLKSNIDIRYALSEQELVMHRLAVAMQKIFDDVQHAYIIDPLNLAKTKNRRRVHGIFKLSHDGEFQITTMTHKPLLANSHESELTFVVYKVKESTKFAGRSDLYRGETKIPPQENYKETPPLRLLVHNIKELKIETWDGSGRWSKDGWDSTRSDWRHKIPNMVRVTLVGWETEVLEGEEKNRDISQEATVEVNSIVFLTNALQFVELHSDNRPKTIRWEKL